MDKVFFESLDQREKEQAARMGVEHAEAELVLVNTKVYALSKVIEAADAWLHIDGEDVADDHKPVSLVLPYHQISHVRFREPRRKQGQAGFGRN